MKLIKRTVAFFIDYTMFILPACIVMAAIEFSGMMNVYVALFIFAVTYSLVLCRDIVNGQSIGKSLFGLRVVELKERRNPKVWQHIVRSLFILLWIVELIMLGINSSRRVGDYVAKTKVVGNAKKIAFKVGIEHIITFLVIAVVLYIVFLLLFLNTKAFRLYYM